MPVQECRDEWSDYYENYVQVCEWVDTPEEGAAAWAAINEAEARYQEAAEAAWGPGGVPPCAGPGSHGENQTCCPGLNTDSQSGRYEYDENGYQYYVDGYTNCNCPSYGCIGENQSIPSPQDGCPAPSCCESLTNQGGVCKPPQGTIVGTYTTTYMASGPGVAFDVKETCNHNSTCDNGYQDVGTYNSLCYERKQRVAWDPPPISAAGKVCVEPNPTSKCPTNIGRVASGKYTSATGGAAQGINNVSGVRLQCTYSSITNPFDPITIGAFTQPGATDLATMQKDWCNAKNYAGLKASGDCRTLYTTRTQNYDFQLVSRIQIENPNGEWATNPGYLQIITQVAAGQNKEAGSSVEGKDLARGMINNYCMTQNRQWADNPAIRFIIKTWALKNSLDIEESTRVFASAVIEGYCINNPDSPKCDCFNATKFRTNIFNACRGNTSNACTDINRLAAAFSEAPDIFKPQVEAIKSYITPNCAVGACVSSAMNLSSEFLPPSSFAELECKSDIQVCLQSIEVGGNIAPGATINQSCKKIITAAGVTVGDTVPSDNRGLTNIQSVNANANAPGGGTLAAVISPSGSTTNTSTTGTPDGGLRQTITSNTPVGIGSSGGPVSYTSPAPAPAPTPKPMSIPLDDTQKKYALAGGGLLGLSFSCVCCIIIIVLAMLIFGGGNKPAAPRVVPLSAYGL